MTASDTSATSDLFAELPHAESLLARSLGLKAGNTPFPWQIRLLRRFLEGEVPRSLDIPTGLGKTATIAIWLVARALGASLPRRLVYVVDRRVVVDQATRTAERLREWVDREPEVRAGLLLDDDRLPVSTLRGQFVDNREWLDDPARPAIVVGTVDMIGSRLLFQGYRASRRIRPFMAGFLGHDALFILDEAHLVPPFERLLERVTGSREDLGTGQILGVRPPPSKLLSLSATGRSRGGQSFELNEEDCAHSVVRKRLAATKLLELRTLEPTQSVAEGAAEAAWSICNEGRAAIRCVIFLSKREDAEKAKACLEKLAGADRVKRGQTPPIETELLVGGRRVYERSLATERLSELGFLAGSTVERARPHFLFATSAGEVGVDLDADHMIGDLVTWERMVQRLGRVNRRGDGAARVVVFAEAGAPDECQASVRALLDRLPRVDGGIDVSPGALLRLQTEARQDPRLGKVVARASTAAPLYPPLERPTLDAWAMTSIHEHPGRPVIAPWLRGWIDDQPQTELAWRAHLPLVNGELPASSVIDRFFQAAPMHLSEQLETETFRVADWIKKRSKKLLAVASGSKAKRAEDPSEIIPSACIGYFRARGARRFDPLSLEDIAGASKRDLERRLAGGELVLDARFGGLTREGLLDASCNEIPVTIDSEGWGLIAPFRVRLVANGDEPSADGDWRERERFPIELSADGDVARWLVVERQLGDYSTEEDRSAGSLLQPLADHQECTAERMRVIGRQLGLPDRAVRLLEIAARLHDEGKRTRRWQRAFNAPPGDVVFAKTPGPVNIALLDGYRHELGSLPYAVQDEEVAALDPDERDFVLHLIASHHGYARPTIETRGCDDAPPSQLAARAREVALRFARLQAKLGPWGLAWWEALLRSADQQASRAVESRSVAKKAGR